MKARIHIIDIVRGVAVLGIFAINFPDIALPGDLAYYHLFTDPEKGSGYWLGILSDALFLDKMRAFFTLLFGVSSFLIIRQMEQRNVGFSGVDLYFRRLWWLLIFGLIHAYVLLWAGEVLFEYALLGMMLFPFRNASRRLLIWIIIGLLSVHASSYVADYEYMKELKQDYDEVQQNLLAGETISEDDEEIIAEWEESISDIQPDPEDIEEDIDAAQGSYSEVYENNIDSVLESKTTDFYEYSFWDMFPFMLLGIVLLRLGFFKDTVDKTIHLAIASLGIGIGFAANLWIYMRYAENYADPVNSIYYAMLGEFARLPLVLGYISLIILVFRLKAARLLGSALAATGKMALSNYVMQTVIANFIVYSFGFGLGLFGEFSRVEMMLVVLGVWLFQIGFSAVFMRHFEYGPLEWVWRSLTYWKIQPLRKITRAGGVSIEAQADSADNPSSN